MKPLIIGMGPAKSYPTGAWHPAAVSTANLCYLISGDPSKRSILDDHFNVINLNQNWRREEGAAWDAILASDAEETLRALIAAKMLRGGRKAFLLGEQVTNFVFGFLRRKDCALALDGWRLLSKCVGHRLCTEDKAASVGKSPGYYDFVAIPVWHPRMLTTSEAKMPPGWQQKMMTALRSAGGLKPMKFKKPHQQSLDLQRCERTIPADRQFPVS
jgi:hypothetical protein